MDPETRSWMVGVGFEADEGEAATESVTLSTGQKRELAGITGLMVASTVFFLTPLVLTAPEPPLEMAPLERIAVPLVTSVAAGEPAPTRIQTLTADRSRGVAPRARGVSRARSAAPLAPARTFVPTAAVMTSGSVASKHTQAAKRKGVSNGLMRVLVGSGRYRVQPFPSPTAN